MEKIAWLISHDIVVDRRIYFFADVLESHGYKVKLFCGYKQEIDEEVTPSYVLRPESQTLVSEYSVPVDTLPQSEHELLREMMDAARVQLETDGRFSRLRPGVDYSDSASGITARFIGCGEYYNILLRCEGNRTVLYSSLSGLCTVHHDISKRAGAYFAACAALQAELDRTIVTKNAQVRMSINEQNQLVAKVHKKGLYTSWLCNIDEQRVYLCDMLPCWPIEQPCVLGGMEFDFDSFRRHIFDFTPILENVARHLGEEVPDVVYVADLPTLPIGYMLKKVTGAKLIVDCHEWWFKQQILFGGDATNVKMSQEYEKKLYPECDLNITVGEYLAEEMSKEYGVPFKAVYSCMSKDLSLGDAKREKSFREEKFGVPSDAKVAMFQGSLTILRNLENMMRATKHLQSNEYLVVVGDGPLRETMERVLEEEGSPQQVRFLGWVRQEELLRYTLNADIGVLPYFPVDEYFSYSVPNKIMEFVEAQLPVLYDGRMKEISAVVGQNNIGKSTNMSDPDSFGKAMSDMLSAKNALGEMRKRFDVCRKKFDFDSQKKCFEEFLAAAGFEL